MRKPAKRSFRQSVGNPQKAAAAKLRKLAETLRDLAAIPSPPSMRHGRPENSLLLFAAEAIERYLTGKSQTLDHAFGLSSPPGRPKGTIESLSVRRRVARATYLRIAGNTWAEVCDRLNYPDSRELRRQCERHHDLVIAIYAKRVARGMRE